MRVAARQRLPVLFTRRLGSIVARNTAPSPRAPTCMFLTDTSSGLDRLLAAGECAMSTIELIGMVTLAWTAINQLSAVEAIRIRLTGQYLPQVATNLLHDESAVSGAI